MDSSNHSILDYAKNILIQEANALLQLSTYLDETFNYVVEAFRDIQGKLIFCGLGKSGHIARKIAATCASTGTPSFFVHPTEALHGDLGMIERMTDLFFFLTQERQ